MEKSTLIRRLADQWFLIILVAVLALGMFSPTAMRPAAQAIPRTFVVATVLFLMSATLEARAMWRVVRRPLPALLAVLINAGLAPPLAWAASRVLQGQLAIGLIVAAAVPCTLASAAVWTRRAGGNDAVALLVTMITNLACFAVVPVWLWLLLGQRTEVDHWLLMERLVTICVIPIVAAQLLRNAHALAMWADAHKSMFGIIAQCGILAIVLQGAVRSGEQLSDGEFGAQDAITIVLLAALLHLALFAIGWQVSRRWKLAPQDGAAVAIAGSQKTLMVGVDVALGFGGLAILPMVAYHAVQLILDTVLADWLRAKVARSP